MTEPIMRVEHLYKIFSTQNTRSKEKEAYEALQKDTPIEEVSKHYQVMIALNDISLNIEEGKILVIIGLSGSGKSTLVRCLNLLHMPTAGKVLYKGTNILEYSPSQMQEFRRTKIAMVFQNFGLMSHRNVLQNVAYGLEVRGVERGQREKEATAMLDMVGLTGWENKSIRSLSGGMKQRVGIARALTNNPEILIMDEAFSALDPLVRNDLQLELLRIQEKMQKTIVFITHDINEAFKLGDTVAILRDGKLIQVASPEEMLSHPADSYVQRFINTVDTTKVLTVRTITEVPGALVREGSGATLAVKVMGVNGVSSAYVLDEHMRYKGIVTLEAALAVLNGAKSYDDALITSVPCIKNPDTLISDIVQLSAKTGFPLPVVDKDGMFLGIVTKAAVLTSLQK